VNVSDGDIRTAGGSGDRIHPHWLPRIGMLIPAGVLSVASIVGATADHSLGGLTAAGIVTVASLYVAA
jgi:hypothetical protein